MRGGEAAEAGGSSLSGRTVGVPGVWLSPLIKHDDVQSALIARLGQLSSDARIHLFELFAHNLTIAARGALADSRLSAEQQVQALKTINECLHRATSRIWVERLGTHKWTDEDFVGMVAGCDIALHSALQGSLRWALEASLGHVEAKARSVE